MEGENKPSPSNPKYVIGRYEFREPWDEVKRKAGLKDLGSQDTFSKLFFDSVADAKRVIDMAKLNKEGWYILEMTDPDGWGRGKVVAQHPRVTQIEEDEDISRARNQFKQHIKAAAINLGPKTLTLHIGNTKIVFERSQAEYDPRRSAAVKGYCGMVITRGDRKRDYFNPSDYITSNGVLQKAKAKRDLGYLLGEDTDEFVSRLSDLNSLKKRMTTGQITDEEFNTYDVKFGTEHLREPVVMSTKEAKILPSVSEVVLRAKFNKTRTKAKPVQSEVSGGR